jgi:hypothetical protein
MSSVAAVVFRLPGVLGPVAFAVLAQVSSTLFIISAKRLFTGYRTPAEVAEDRRFVMFMVIMGVLMVTSVLIFG